MREDFNSIRRLRYAIPETIDPPTSICVMVNVPNDLRHIAAFWGQLFALTKWYAWLGDEGHSGKELAEVWRNVYEEARASGCMNYILRQSPFDPCELQRSYDEGETWETLYNARQCAVDTFKDLDGGHSQPGEQPGGADPDPDQCFDLDITVLGSGQTLIPLPIQSGWTLKFTQIVGAWTDHVFPSDWTCPDGSWFVLGECNDAVHRAAQSGDPVGSAYHMQLIARLPDGTFTEIPLDGSDYVVPVGQPLGNFILQPNDEILSDNQGSVTLHVQACNSHKDVTWELVQGTGPTGANYGQVVEFVSTAPYPGQFYFRNFNVSCVKLTVVGLDDYTALGGYGYVWNGTDCTDTFYYNDNYTTITPLDWDPDRCIKLVQFQGGSQFTIRLRIDEDCG